MSNYLIRFVVAGAVALLMTLPTTAIAADVVASEDEARAAEIASFVDAWTSGMLSKDLATVQALPSGDAYAHWTDADRTEAIERLFASLEENRPLETKPIHDEAEAAFVKGFLHGYIFDRAALEASGQELQQQVDAAREAKQIENDAAAVNRNEAILAAAAPHAEMVAAQTALWASLSPDAVLTAGDVLTLVPQTPEELDPVFAVVDPLLASAAGMSATGTYTLRVVSAGKETIVSAVPFCVPIPLDADMDGTTGLVGIDVTANLCLSGTPEASADLSEEGILRAIAGGAGPSLEVVQVDTGALGLPDFAPASEMIIEAYVPLENGKQMARIGFDTMDTGMPASMRVTLIPTIEAWSGAPGAIRDAVDADEASADARTAGDMVADAAGTDLPWNEVDGLPARLDQETAPARALAEQILSDAQAQANAAVEQATNDANAALAPVLAEAQTQADGVQAAAADALADANEAAQPAVALVGETADFYTGIATGVVEDGSATVQPVVDEAFADVSEAAAPAVLLVEETRDFYLGVAEARLAAAQAALAAAKATAYQTVVDVNTQAGLAKNEYVYGDGLTGQLPPMSAAPPALPATPFDDEPAEVSGAVAESAASTSGPRPAPSFGLQVESTGANGALVVVGGFATREDTALPFTDEANVVLKFTPAPALLKLLVEPKGDTAYVRIDSPSPTTMEALLATRADERVSVAGLVIGPLPTLTELTLGRADVQFSATDNIDILGLFIYDFASYADFVALFEDGVFTGRYAHAIASNLPMAFTLSYDEDAGVLEYGSEGGRLGGLDVAQGRFVADQLSGYWTQGTLLDLPTSFRLAADRSASAFDASEPIGSAEFLRTNGPVLVNAPPAFVVAYRVGSVDMIHLRILGIQRLGLVDERITMDLDGGYPLQFNLVNGATQIYGQFITMPDHLALALTRSGEVQTVDVTFLPSGFGLWAGMRSPSLGADTAIVSVSNLAGRVVATITPSVPRLDWQASQTTGGVFAGLYNPAGWKGYFGLGQIPASMVVSLDQVPQGFPTLGYLASASTLDMVAYGGPQLLTGIGSVYLELINVPRFGLGFSISGMTYSLWSNGPERLGRWYMDVTGMQFSVSPISYHNRWVDNWILQVGADVEFAGTIIIRHFYLLADNLASLVVTVTAPSLYVAVNGVLGMAFDTLMYTSGYASLYVKALWGWICIICYYVSFNRAGEVPTFFHTWGYAWNVWRWNYISYPVGMCGWWSVRIEQRWVEIGLRLPSGFSTYANAYWLSYGSTNLFVNPGGLVPFELVYLYALIQGFSAYFREYATRYCT